MKYTSVIRAHHHFVFAGPFGPTLDPRLYISSCPCEALTAQHGVLRRAILAFLGFISAPEFGELLYGPQLVGHSNFTNSLGTYSLDRATSVAASLDPSRDPDNFSTFVSSPPMKAGVAAGAPLIRAPR